jgi:hypothetical protein
VNGLLKIKNLMKKNFLIFFLIFSFFAANLFAQISRSTSFDDRPVCEESKGVWRQFGNGCANYCNPQFDQFSICSQSLVYGCDCGKNRCWDGKTCVALKDYKKIFDVEQAEQKKVLDAAKEKRQAEAKQNQQAIMAKLKAANSTDPSKNPGDNSNPSDPQSPITVIDPQPNTQLTPMQLPVATDPQPAGSTTPVEIPPFFAQKQANAANQQKQNSANQAQTPGIINLPISIEASTPPGLPEIPLPK